MNRWWGSSADSDKQSSERDSRAARRTIRNLPLQLPVVSSEDEYEDCDTSLLFSTDGQVDLETSSNASTSAAANMVDAAAAAELVRQKALPVEDADYQDDAESWKKELKLKFDLSDIKYWFNATEADMKKFGINSQWEKKNAVASMLPPEVTEEVKPILRLTQAEAGEFIYKDLKTEIMSIYGPKEEDAFKKARSLKLGSGRPSALGKKLIHAICPGAKPFEGCHCSKMVFGFWEDQMSPPIKSALAGQQFNKDTYQAIFKLADQVWLANGGAAQPAVVAAITQPSTTNPQDELPQVAAVTRGRGRGGNPRGGRGRGRGGGQNRGAYNNNNTSNQNTSGSGQNQNASSNPSSSSTKPHQKGQKHADLPSNASWACAQHWKRGRGAPYCSDPLVCQWVNIVAPRTA